MKIEVCVPDLATTADTVKVVKWLVAVGDRVARGQVLLEVETDKSVMEVESFAEGTVASLLAAVDDEIEIGAAVAVIDDGRGEGPVERETLPDAAAPAGSEPEPTAGGASGGPAPKAGERGGMFARNRARREQEPGARDAGPVLTAAQQAAARRLTQSKQSIPHFYLSRPVVMEAVLWARETLTPPPVWDAFIVHALARAGTAFPRFRCRYEDGSLVPVPEAGIGVAVDLDGDLHVITVQAAEGKGVAEISAEIRAGVDALRAGDSSVRKPCERWVTVSNLGSTGVEEFAAIINPPETAILALGRTRRVPVVSDTGDVVAVWRAGLTLSVDHRVVSGLYAARFLDAVAASLEEPAD